MKQRIRLTESQLHNIIRRCINEVAVQGKSGKTYSLHGDNSDDWMRVGLARQYKEGYNNKVARDMENFVKSKTKKSKNGGTLTQDDVKEWVNDAKDIADNMKNESRRSRMNRIVKESVDSALRDSRFNGITDQIDWYGGFSEEHGLNKRQIEHLKDLRDTVVCFGEAGLRWARFADDILKENGYDDDTMALY